MAARSGVFAQIYGGLGNQMFQYAAARALAWRTGQDLILDTRHYHSHAAFPFGLGHFSISGQEGAAAELPPEKASLLRHALWRGLRLAPLFLSEQRLGFNQRIIAARGSVYLHGYWQSERYFSDYADAIRREFAFCAPPDAENAAWLAEISSENALSLHVRRGDYVNNPKTNAAHGTCSVSYYQSAVRLAADKSGAPPVIYVFSDDPQWARDNLRFPFPSKVLGHNGPDRNFEDMRLMCACKSHIIANSSFSWWGAWLNPSRGKIVIAPQNWYARPDLSNPDICPEDWFRLSA